MNELQQFLLMAPVLLFSLVAHEYAHGWAALRQGDPTAYQLGRLTFNPVRHIDPFLTIALPLLTFFSGGFIFGGAKPMPVVARNFRNYRRGDIIVSMAGIVSNIAIALVCIALYMVLGLAGRAAPDVADTLALLQLMMYYGIVINAALAMFNLLPLPPLDGSHVVKYLLPPAWSLRYQRMGMFGLAILVLLFASGVGKSLFALWMAPVGFALSGTFRMLGAFGLPNPFIPGVS